MQISRMRDAIVFLLRLECCQGSRTSPCGAARKDATLRFTGDSSRVAGCLPTSSSVDHRRKPRAQFRPTRGLPCDHHTGFPGRRRGDSSPWSRRPSSSPQFRPHSRRPPLEVPSPPCRIVARRVRRRPGTIGEIQWCHRGDWPCLGPPSSSPTPATIGSVVSTAVW